MIGPFVETPDANLPDLRDRARAALDIGRMAEARRFAFEAAACVYARQDEYVETCRVLVDVFARDGDPRAALTAAWYAGDARSASLLGRVPPVDRARTRIAEARAAAEPRRGALLGEAAALLERARLFARAAVVREAGGEKAAARSLWARVADGIPTDDAMGQYLAGLARFDVARMARDLGDEAGAREATVAAVRLLEEAADRFEAGGERERAYDCFDVLVAVGHESGEFEHVLEGYVNVVRILREDLLRSHALGRFERVIAEARRRGEAAAAATLAREMAEYARKQGLPRVATRATLLEAETWCEVARATGRRGGPPEIVENALASALLSYAALGQYARVGELYAELGALPLEAARRAHYGRAGTRYAGARNEPIDAAPAGEGAEDGETTDVWHVDLLEWEGGGSAAEACADVMLDVEKWPETLRRRAMLARLVALSVETAEGAPAEAWAGLADQLGALVHYSALSPLEHLLRRPEPRVRTAVLRALGRFLFKRTFVALRAGLADPDPHVAREAAASLARMRFVAAFDPLVRVWREAGSDRVRSAAVAALAHIDTPEAAEAMIEVVETGTSADREAAVGAVRRAGGRHFADLAAQRLAAASPAARAALRRALEGAPDG